MKRKRVEDGDPNIEIVLTPLYRGLYLVSVIHKEVLSPIGSVWFTIYGADKKTAFINNLYVPKHARGMGIGRFLAKKFMEQFDIIITSLSATTIEGANLGKRLGFKRDENTDLWYWNKWKP